LPGLHRETRGGRKSRPDYGLIASRPTRRPVNDSPNCRSVLQSDSLSGSVGTKIRYAAIRVQFQGCVEPFIEDSAHSRYDVLTLPVPIRGCHGRRIGPAVDSLGRVAETGPANRAPPELRMPRTLTLILQVDSLSLRVPPANFLSAYGVPNDRSSFLEWSSAPPTKGLRCWGGHPGSPRTGLRSWVFKVLLTKRPRRLARPRTPPFHGDNTGSNPVGDANRISYL
jgi:hypothetical protein